MIALDTNCPRLNNTHAYSINTLEQPCSEDPLSYNIIRHPITVGRSVRHPESITIRDIAYVMEAIKHGDYEGYNLKQNIGIIRNMTDKAAQKNAKLSLPWFSGSLMHKSRTNANVKQASFMVFDLDHVANPEELKALAVSKLPYIHYAFLSPVDGLKLIAQFTKPITSEAVYRRVYVFLALQIEWVCKHICDATPDWSRACFMSHDAKMIVNHHCQPLDAQVSYKQATSVMEIPFPRSSAVGSSGLPTGKVCQPLAGREERSSGLPTGKVCQPLAGREEVILPKGTSEQNSRGDAGTPNNYSRETREHLSSGDAGIPINLSSGDAGIPQSSSDYAKAERIIAVLSQISIPYRDWIKIGQALYSGFGDSGKALWNMFLNNPNYQDTQKSLDVHWRSFRSVHSIKLASLFYIAEQYGINHE